MKRSYLSNFFQKCHFHGSHQPVMASEVLNLFNPKIEKTFLDMTFGNGGHSKFLLDSNTNNKVFGLDRDPVSNKMAQQFETYYKGRFKALVGKFSEIDSLLPLNQEFDGILFDLGCSSMQFDDELRGFAVSKDGPLDMRMSSDRDNISAKDVINNLTTDELSEIILKYGEERNFEKISHAIVNARNTMGPIQTTGELAKIIESSFYKFDFYGLNTTSSPHKLDKIGRHSHVATKTFQALRIFVNNELNELDTALRKCHKILKQPYGEKGEDAASTNREHVASATWHAGVNSGLGARGQTDLYKYLSSKSPHSQLPYTNVPLVVVISFHSLEDRIVKTHFQGHVDVENVLSACDFQEYPPRQTNIHQKINLAAAKEDFQSSTAAKILNARRWVPFNKKVVEHGMAEIAINPRSRSAKLRAAYKL